MNKRSLCFVVFMFLLLGLNAKEIEKKLYINRGDKSFHPLGFNPFPFLAFNSSDSFNSQNTFIETKPGDKLILTIYNKDIEQHTVHFKELSLSTGSISPNDSLSLNIKVTENTIVTFVDSLEKYRSLGLKSFLKVWEPNPNQFIWSLNELQTNLSEAINNSLSFDIDTFNPDYFTINDNVHPEISLDSVAKVEARVGDSIFIFVINSGLMHHAIHFHGYHVDILKSSKNRGLEGRNKDSIPIKPGEYQVYLLVPHQEGEYPVHDHNLVATTGGGNYPNGMMVMMKIDP